MLAIAGYTIDRVIRVSEQESEVALELASGALCVVRCPVPKRDALLSWAKLSLGFESPVALRILDGEVLDGAEFTYRAVRSVEPLDGNALEVWLLGRPGPYRFSSRSPDAERQCALLERSSRTNEKLLFLIEKEIEAVSELSPAEVEELSELGGVGCSGE